MDFNPRGLRRPRRVIAGLVGSKYAFQSTRPSQTSTNPFYGQIFPLRISIHEAFADLDLLSPLLLIAGIDFNPRGLRRPRRRWFKSTSRYSLFQSTRPSQTSTQLGGGKYAAHRISIHEAFADLDRQEAHNSIPVFDFNPRGLRRPRLHPTSLFP